MYNISYTCTYTFSLLKERAKLLKKKKKKRVFWVNRLNFFPSEFWGAPSPATPSGLVQLPGVPPGPRGRAARAPCRARPERLEGLEGIATAATGGGGRFEGLGQ